MQFENFYKDLFYDKMVRHWAFFVFLVAGAFIVFLLMPEAPKPKVMTDSERIQNIESLCKNLPRPEGFQFSSNHEPFYNTNSVSVDYIYRTYRSVEEIYPTFLIWFDNNGWTDDKLSYKPVSFSHEKWTISIRHDQRTEGIYFIVTCAEKR